jgi:hypothetical protein
MNNNLKRNLSNAVAFIFLVAVIAAYVLGMFSLWIHDRYPDIEEGLLRCWMAC